VVRVVSLVAATVAVAAAPAAANEPGLLAQWSFDEGAGQVAHDSGPFGLDAVLGLTQQADSADPGWINGSSGSALRFDGTSSVRLPDTARLAPQHLTIETTARAAQSPGRFRYLVSRGGRGCYSSSYGLYSGPTGGLAFYVFDGSHYFLSPAARRGDVWDGKWHDLRGVFDGATLRLFVDGREVGEPMAAPLRIDYAIPHAAALLGQYAGDCALGFAGDLDSVRLLSDVAEPAPGTPKPPGLPAGAPGTTLPAGSPDTESAPEPGKAPATTPSPSKPGCSVRLSRRTIVAGRRTIVRARLAHAPSKRKVTLSARRGGARKVVATARVSRTGQARLVFKAPRAGRLTIHVIGRSGCAAAQLRVTK
jgi:hypothetical protein